MSCEKEKGVGRAALSLGIWACAVADWDLGRLPATRRALAERGIVRFVR